MFEVSMDKLEMSPQPLCENHSTYTTAGSDLFWNIYCDCLYI